MRQMVSEHGVAVTTVVANADFRKYKGGVFAGCKQQKNKVQEKPNHVVAVVGFGKDAGGKPYWLVQNSRGPTWGEKGYIRIQRGVGMCGIGKALAYVECEPTVECKAGDDDCEDDQAQTQNSGEYENINDADDAKDEEDEE